MPRLIDTEKLVEYKASGVSELTEWQQGWNDALDFVINEVPTVDTERHGHWNTERNPMKYQTQPYVHVCSECGTAFPYKMPYCGECGARMDERREDEKNTNTI